MFEDLITFGNMRLEFKINCQLIDCINLKQTSYTKKFGTHQHYIIGSDNIFGITYYSIICKLIGYVEKIVFQSNPNGI